MRSPAAASLRSIALTYCPRIVFVASSSAPDCTSVTPYAILMILGKWLERRNSRIASLKGSRVSSRLPMPMGCPGSLCTCRGPKIRSVLFASLCRTSFRLKSSAKGPEIISVPSLVLLVLTSGENSDPKDCAS